MSHLPASRSCFLLGNGLDLGAERRASQVTAPLDGPPGSHFLARIALVLTERVNCGQDEMRAWLVSTDVEEMELQLAETRRAMLQQEGFNEVGSCRNQTRNFIFIFFAVQVCPRTSVSCLCFRSVVPPLSREGTVKLGFPRACVRPPHVGQMRVCGRIALS